MLHQSMIARPSVSRTWPGLLLGRSYGVPNYHVRMAIPMVLDCDPGHDDAMALLLAVADPAGELLA
jgi:hypothetical protein